MQIQKSIENAKKRLNTPLAIVLDIDETLLNPLPPWTQWVNENMGTNLTVKDVELAGNLVKVFQNTKHFDEILVNIKKLRINQEINADLPYVEGAKEGISILSAIPEITFSCYLTTRPEVITEITLNDLRVKGFPQIPLIIRPDNIERANTVEWKLSVLEELNKSFDGLLVMIDDNIELAKAIAERNINSIKKIVTILYNGPITYARVAKENIVTNEDLCFYVSKWDNIPTICNKIIENDKI